MGSALLDTTPGTVANSAAAATEAAARISTGEALRQQAAERLAAHRNKRAGLKPARDTAQQATTSANARASQIAAAVAERYAKSQSYRAFLAAEAERAVQQARAAAEVAAIKAEAMEAAQQSLLDAFEIDIPSDIIPEASRTPAPELEPQLKSRFESPLEPQDLSFWPEAEVPQLTRHAAPRHSPRPTVVHRPEHVAGTSHEPAPVPPIAAARYAVRAEDELFLPKLAREALHENRMFQRDDAEALALDEEIAFRHSPVFEDFTTRPEPLPANLIQFPRQLVASRKARPRFAEGPLREEATDQGDGQLRIFEVDTAQISTEPVSQEAQAAQWTSIFLDAPQPAPAAAPEPLPAPTTAVGPPGAASMARRATSAAINGCVIGLAVAAFAAAAMVTSGNVETLRALSMGTVLGLLRTADGRSLLGDGTIIAIILCFTYQALFFTFSTATPGMRCTRIGLCTFDDNNPTRRRMRRRILAVLLSAIPFGLGFIWAALDEERLSWHDRVSGTYQREY
jgi:uncharacterized RDD family membrane protein YckC